ncbi:protein LKAAEAR1 [Paramormyrops kingsleyae]|uniref:protein LKAAEAR1 n=1 Tax=Paramormyrops kingsleyae TaxID=1676925 RepID=UPI000CD5DA18|nr:protein LKAAEAR1 [Paramormyrops kingsleyae]
MSNVTNNRRSKPASEIRRMCPQQRARQLAYQEQSKDVRKAVTASEHRVRERCAAARENVPAADATQEEERKLRGALIGQLKAAEARDRIRLMRLRYQTLRTQEINLMISWQSTAQNAIRLHLLMPVKEDKVALHDTLDKIQRARVEQLLEDKQGLTFIRS